MERVSSVVDVTQNGIMATLGSQRRVNEGFCLGVLGFGF